MTIPLHRPSLDEKEIVAAVGALKAGHIIGNGVIGPKLERQIEKDLKVRHILLTPSGTHALELAMAAANVGPGDEVILPSFTFPSVATSILRQRAKPVFADICKDTLNLNPQDIERKITRRTKAVVPVHYAGVSCDMGSILALAKASRLLVIEDAAHAVGAAYHGKPLGTLGDAGCFSFHATKNITCGEGGAFATHSDALARRAELFREKGTNRAAFVRGQVKKYTWVSDGSSFVLSDILAAILSEQWKKRMKINRKRGELFRAYMTALKDLEQAGLCSLPVLPAQCDSSYHLFWVLLPTKKMRDYCMQYLRNRGIQATFHFQPLHASPYARKVLKCREHLPVSEMAGNCILRLPLFPNLKKSEVLSICEELHRSLRRRSHPNIYP